MPEHTPSSPLLRPDENYVRFIAMGGLDEVGMNCALIECNGSMLMVDCGMTFPETGNFGVDVILPDWSYILDNLDHLDGIVLTHGHEDHIGALPFFLEEVDVPVYGGRLTLGMVKKKLESHNLADEVELVAVEPGDRLRIGEFDVEFVHVNHSVPNAMAVAFTTPLGRLMFTGDWKLDQTPLYEPVTDLQTLASFGQEDGLLALFGDSTNSSVPGYSRSERDVRNGIENVIEEAKGRVIIAQFSSNLHRIAAILEIAARHGRHVALLGRSLVKNFGIARELGFVPGDHVDVLIDPNKLDKYADDKLIVISTGSQAEPRSSLARMSYGDHHQISIGAADTIILSARQIPGNEYGINTMVNNLVKRGARVITAGEEGIHGSGHGKQEEIKLMLGLTRPRYLVPVHGEYRMRKAHAELGRKVGVPNTLLVEDGDVLQWTNQGAKVIGRVRVGRQLVDGRTVGDFEDMQIRDRQKLASAGLIVAFAVMDRDKGELVKMPDLMQRGVVGLTEAEAILEEASRAAFEGVANLPAAARRDLSEVEEAIRVHVRRYFRKQFDRKPVVIPIVHEL